MKDRKQRNGDQIFLLGKVILARAKKGKIGAETEGAKKKKKETKIVQNQRCSNFWTIAWQGETKSPRTLLFSRFPVSTGKRCCVIKLD